MNHPKSMFQLSGVHYNPKAHQEPSSQDLARAVKATHFRSKTGEAICKGFHLKFKGVDFFVGA